MITFPNSSIQGLQISFQITFNEAVAMSLKAIRLKKDINQRQIYKALGMKSSTYSNIDKGLVTISVATLRNIANCLNVSVALVYELAESIYAHSNNTDHYPDQHSSLCYCA